MPTYEFICRECKTNFRESTSIKDKKAGEIACPHCQAKDLQEIFSTNGAKSCSSSCSSSGCGSGCSGCH